MHVWRRTLNSDDQALLSEWRTMLRKEAEVKIIPSALVPTYINEKVYHWIQVEKITEMPDEYNALIYHFPLTNWESVCYHDSKIAVVLCAYVGFHTFQSALRRVKEPDFMSEFMKAHTKDRDQEKAQMKRLGSDHDFYYFGRSLGELFTKFLEDHLK